MEVHCHITQVFSCLPLKFLSQNFGQLSKLHLERSSIDVNIGHSSRLSAQLLGGVEHFPLNAYNPAPALTCPAPAAYHPFNPHEISSSWLPRPSRTTVSCSSWGGAVRERSSPPRTRAAGDASPSASCRKRWRIPPPWLNSNG